MSEATLWADATQHIKQHPHESWWDCTIGGIICPCGGNVGMLDAMGDEQACEKCGRKYRLRAIIEVAMTIVYDQS